MNTNGNNSLNLCLACISEFVKLTLQMVVKMFENNIGKIKRQVSSFIT